MSFTTAIHPDRTIELVLEALQELIEYELAVVLGMENDGRLVVRGAAGPLANRRFLDFSLRLEDRPDLKEIMAGGNAHLFNTDASFIDLYAALFDFPAGHSCLVLPLLADGNPIGLLTMDHRSCGHFTPKIISFISIIARLLSLAISQADAVHSLTRTEHEKEAQKRDISDSLVGSSPAWRRVLDEIRLVAPTDASVLLLGETGTGKEELAAALHRISPRAEKPFIAVNCSALTTALAESELLGHEKGSFTGSVALRKGRFELADGGTLFLDEIADMPLEIQPKILRVIESGKFERVGGETTVRTDVRIVAATNKDMEKEVAAGRFREDLFYRLALFPVNIPPLRERGGDALLLAEFFLTRLRLELGEAALRFSASALAEIQCRPWKGNARELKNAVSRAAILARGGVIDAGHFIPETGRFSVAMLSGSTWESAMRAVIEDAIRRGGGRIRGSGGAAELLGVKATTLQSRMKKLGM